MTKYFISTLFLLFMFCLCGCGQTKAPAVANKPAEPATVMYHKTVEVEVVDSRITFCNPKSHAFAGFVKIKSNEYNLEATCDIHNNSPYGYEVYTRTLKKGDKIKATLYTWKKGDTIVKRELDGLVR